MANSIATKLAAGMRRSIRPGVIKLRDFVLGRPSARKLLAEVKTVESLVATGHDPLHAAYTCGQNYLSVFAELASHLPEFKEYRAIAGNAEETYLPGWPPMSPVSQSYFTCWSFLDLPFGTEAETICSVAIEIGRHFGMPADFALTLEAMSESAMGIYEHLGWHEGKVGLRDIVDGVIYPCVVPSNYQGRAGELWFVRLLPPLGAAFDYGVAFTSPYILVDTTKADWLAFFERQERQLPLRLTAADQAAHRKALLKRGLEPNYWSEYIFLAYHDAQDSAISLCGIPDLPHSLPHADLSHDGDEE